MPVGACWCLLVPVGACWWLLSVCVVDVFKIFGPLPQTPLRWTALPLDRPKFRSLFSLSRRKFLSFFSRWVVFSLNSGGVFEGRNPKMCTFGLSGCRVKPRRPHQTGPPGLHTTTRELQTCTFERTGASNTTKIPRKRPKEREKRIKNCGGREKKREILGPPPFGASPFGPPPFGPPPFGAPSLRGPHPTLRGPHPLGPHHDTKNIGQKLDWPKLDWPKLALAKTAMAKNGLAKNWIGQNWSNQDGQNGIGQSRSLPRVQGSGFRVQGLGFRV